MAEHFEGKIYAYEIWNEPNAEFFLDPVDPAGYTAMLQAAYTAIKDVDDSILVIGGVLGSGLTLGSKTMNPVDFLEGMYVAGAHGSFDALSFHPYKYDMKFSEGGSQIESPLRQLEDMRDLMHLWGDGDLKVWASEYGLPTMLPVPDGEDELTPEHQAEFIRDS